MGTCCQSIQCLLAEHRTATTRFSSTKKRKQQPTKFFLLKTASKVFLLIAIQLLSAFSLFSQAYQFKSYNVDNGISQPYIYTINQDKNGYLWIGTGEGLCKFDGISFKSFYTTDGIAENFVTASFKDEARNLWLGFNQGSVTFYDGKVFKSINTSGFTKSPVTAIATDDKGNAWCATQNDGIFRISKKFEVSVFYELNIQGCFFLLLHHFMSAACPHIVAGCFAQFFFLEDGNNVHIAIIIKIKIRNINGYYILFN